MRTNSISHVSSGQGRGFCGAMGNGASRVAVVDVFLVRAQVEDEERDGSYSVTLAILKCL